MNVFDPGHHYGLAHLDAEIPTLELLRFVKRVGSKYPGNHAPAYSGTTTQEVIRALIDRTKYVDAQIDQTNMVSQQGHIYNANVLRHLRFALAWLEVRAAHERNDDSAQLAVWDALDRIEALETCPGCHHVLCKRNHE